MSKAAGYYLKAEKFGDPTARKAYYGLVKKIKDVYGDEKRKAQFKKLITVYLNDPQIKDPEFYGDLAKMSLKANSGYFNLACAAECYLKATTLEDPVAREAYYGLFDKVEDAPYSERKSQLKELVEIYLRKAEKQDINFLKNLAQELRKESSFDNSGRAAHCYLKIVELGDPAGKREFYGLLEKFDELCSCDQPKAAEHLFPICLQEAGRDERVEPLLERNYGNGYFLRGFFSYYVQRGDAVSIEAAFELYNKYRVASNITASLMLSPFFNTYLRKWMGEMWKLAVCSLRCLRDLEGR